MCLSDLRSLSPAELVTLCLEGEAAAWDELFRRYTLDIKKKIIKTLLYWQQGELARNPDVVQEINLKIVEKLFLKRILETLNDPNAIGAWLKSVAKSTTLDWLKSCHTQKNLPEKQAKAFSISLDAPVNADGNLTFHEIVADETNYDSTAAPGQLEELRKDMARLSERDLWALRLKTLFYDFITAEETKDLANFLGRPLAEVAAQVAELYDRLLAKYAKKDKTYESAVRIHSVIRHLAYRLLEDIKNSDLPKEDRIEREKDIRERSKRMETLIRSTNQLIVPTNMQIAEILGIPKGKEGQISIRILRARVRLKEMTSGRHDRKN